MAKVIEKIEPKAVLKHCAELGLDLKTLASCLAVHTKTIQRWQEGAAEPNEAGLRFLEKLETIHALAAGLLKKDKRKAWLLAPNQSLGGERPLDAIAHGEVDRVKDVLAMLEWGIYS